MKRDTLVLKFEHAESKANNKNLFSLPFSKDDYYLELVNVEIFKPLDMSV